MRRGELFALTWRSVELQGGRITVHGATAKSGRTRHLPLNSEALAVLHGWHDQSADKSGLVFPAKSGAAFNNVRRSWEGVLRKDAEITGFRWHDLRHTFASKLVMAGVDLNTVRELLGHSDYAMTQRYAHFAPEHKAAAVAKLVSAIPPIREVAANELFRYSRRKGIATRQAWLLTGNLPRLTTEERQRRRTNA